MTFFNRLPWRPRVDEEVEEELAFHIEMRTREYIASGMDPETARRKAERRFGDLTRMRTTLRALGRARNRQMGQLFGVSRTDPLTIAAASPRSSAWRWWRAPSRRVARRLSIRPALQSE